MHSRIISFIEKNDILSNNQFGFRGKRSTVQAVISLIEDIKLNYYNESLVTKCTFLDLKKAFDPVDHKILLKKCYGYGLRGPVYKILESYLNNIPPF